MVGLPEAFGRVFEIGGPERLTYLEMLQVAAEVSSGHRVPIVRVPVLTPQALVVLAGAGDRRRRTTGRNLIDSMGIEVVVTDDSIRDLVPIEPVPYAEAVRRALEDKGQD